MFSRSLWKYFALGFSVALASLVVLLAGPAGAEAATAALPSEVRLEPWVVSILVGTVTPVVTGIATKLGASSGVKALAAIFFVAVGTVLNVVTSNNGTFVVRDAVVLFVCTFVIHVATYYGIWKPVGGGTVPGARVFPEFGVGG